MASNTNSRGVRGVADWLTAFMPVVMVLCAGCGSRAPAVTPTTQSFAQVVDRAAYEKIIAGLHGKIVLVDFWATWCLPCMAQLPHTVELDKRFRDRGLAVVTVSFDDPDSLEQVRAALAANDADSLTNLVSREGGSPQSISDFEIAGGAIPHYKLYDRSGQLRQTFAIDPSARTQFTSADIETAVAKLLAE